MAVVKPKSARWFVYVVRCRDGSLYTGASNDVAKRVAAHNAGKGARYTRSRRPVRLVWQRRVAGKIAALRLEWSIKQLSREEKVALVSQARKKGVRRRST